MYFNKQTNINPIDLYKLNMAQEKGKQKNVSSTTNSNDSKKSPSLEQLMEIVGFHNTMFIGPDDPKYQGHYVAKEELISPFVLAYGEDVGKLREEAIRKGCKEPIIFYMPIPGEDTIYRQSA